MKSKKPKIVAIVGLVGSGKSSVAKYLAKLIGAKVISANAIRVALRKKNKGYDQVANLVEKETSLAIKRGKNVILDSDFVNSKKREKLESKASKLAKIFYLRIFSEKDIMIGRLISAKYTSNDLYGGASTDWPGKNKGAIVALREMWRRTPHHYKWSEIGGGRFELRKLPIKFIAEIDTTTQSWKTQIKKSAKRIREN